MKTVKAILGLLLTVAVVGGIWWGVAKAPRIFDAAMTGDWPTAETTQYMVDAYGFDLRAYEWITPSGKVCNMTFTTDGPVGIDCE